MLFKVINELRLDKRKRSYHFHCKLVFTWWLWWYLMCDWHIVWQFIFCFVCLFCFLLFCVSFFLCFWIASGDLWLSSQTISTSFFSRRWSQNTEFPLLAVVHTVWLREHNWAARNLGRLNPHWSDERVYQEAKKLTLAELQHVTYDEFLPIVLNRQTRARFNLISAPRGHNTVYDPSVDATMFNAFGAAAYRFGHSLVRSTLAHSNANFQTETVFQGANTFNRPLTIWQPNQEGPERFARWMTVVPKERSDRFVTDALRNNLSGAQMATPWIWPHWIYSADGITVYRATISTGKIYSSYQRFFFQHIWIS